MQDGRCVVWWGHELINYWLVIKFKSRISGKMFTHVIHDDDYYYYYDDDDDDDDDDDADADADDADDDAAADDDISWCRCCKLTHHST